MIIFLKFIWEWVFFNVKLWPQHILYCYSYDVVLLLMLQVIYIQALVVVVLLGKLMQKVFFGQLRAAEFEASDMNTNGTVTR